MLGSRNGYSSLDGSRNVGFFQNMLYVLLGFSLLVIAGVIGGIVLGAVTLNRVNTTCAATTCATESGNGASPCSCTYTTTRFDQLSTSISSSLTTITNAITACCNALTNLITTSQTNQTAIILQAIQNKSREEAYRELDALWLWAYQNWACTDLAFGSINCVTNGDKAYYNQPVTYRNLFPGADNAIKAQMAAKWAALPNKNLLDPVDVQTALHMLPILSTYPYNPPAGTDVYAPQNQTCTDGLKVLHILSYSAAGHLMTRSTFGPVRDVNPRFHQQLRFVAYNNATFATELALFDGFINWVQQHISGNIYGTMLGTYPGILGGPLLRSSTLASALALQTMLNPLSSSYDPWTPAMAVMGFNLTVSQQTTFQAKLAAAKVAADAWVIYVNTTFPYYSAPARPLDLYFAGPDELFGRNNFSTCPLQIFLSHHYPFTRDGLLALHNFYMSEYNGNMSRLQAYGEAVFGSNFTATPNSNAVWFGSLPAGAVPAGQKQPVRYPTNFCATGNSRNITANSLTYNVVGNWHMFSQKAAGRAAWYMDWSSQSACDTFNNAGVNGASLFTSLDTFDWETYGYGHMFMGNFPNTPYTPDTVMVHEYTHLHHLFHAIYDTAPFKHHVNKVRGIANLNQGVGDGDAFFGTQGHSSRQATEGIAQLAEYHLDLNTPIITDPVFKLNNMMQWYFFRFKPSIEWTGVQMAGWDFATFLNFSVTNPAGPFTSGNHTARYIQRKNALPFSTNFAYAIGYYRWRRLEALGQAQCGAAYDYRAPTTRAIMRGLRSMDVHELDVMNNYILAGCPKDYYVETPDM
jgi:hypothetical protein